MSFDHPAFPDSTSLEHVPSVNQLEQDRALFVGAKYASYYQAQFEKITPKKQYAGFNIAAFFLGVVWLFYRKMYSYGFMAIGLIVAIGIVEILLEIESSGANIDLAVAFGMFGNTLYRHHVDQQIAKTRQLGSGSVNTELENRGGTNIVAGSILLVIWLGLVALAISAS
jgi:hypothetical protein